MTDLLVFTDLDGTLLDHHSYSYEPALPALQRLAAAAVPVIFNSSKTAAEIDQLRRELDNRHPFIVENGSAVCSPAGYFIPDALPGAHAGQACAVRTFGPGYPDILGRLHRIREGAGCRFRGFSDMTRDELATVTGLDPAAAARAQQRHASEPLLWEDTDAALEQFRRDLRKSELSLVRGGRFFHVMGEVDKADALRWLTNRYRQTWPNRRWQTVALGDSPNDRAMLEAADLAVTIPPAEGRPLQLARNTHVICPADPGPRGWQDAMTRILNRETDKGA
ncbi:MAG: mannosyl-3-phosphoglycerate phosphatase [Desulfuromonas sp.]|uniref:HAD-IIB family hydrolase n=1 Tax=Desulfuromonas sp. TaxID=892 RepID=UPI000CB5982C|nr:HAD-IIB family hydrolase [Desulfuromonas sp.]PLX85455.1 MAG: mannosyl-3-phosphoglycerate phosphatase [Desulfuromonas sp.]